MCPEATVQYIPMQTNFLELQFCGMKQKITRRLDKADALNKMVYSYKPQVGYYYLLSRWCLI